MVKGGAYAGTGVVADADADVVVTEETAGMDDDAIAIRFLLLRCTPRDKGDKGWIP